MPKAEGEILKLYEDTYEATIAASDIWRQLRKAVAERTQGESLIGRTPSRKFLQYQNQRKTSGHQQH